jgi:TRAP transporter TAXI family solute receptor
LTIRIVIDKIRTKLKQKEENMDKGKKLTFMSLFPNSGWEALGEIMRKALSHEGFELEITRATRENRVASVASGNVDFGVNEEHEVWWAYHGRGPFEGHSVPDLRAIAVVAQPAWMPFAVTYETRLTAIEQIKEQKFPLRIYTLHDSIRGRVSSAAFLTERIFEAYGFTLQDIENWGGKHWTGENGGNEAIREHNFDAIIVRAYPGYGALGKLWQEATILNNLRFLPISSKVLDELSKKYHYRRDFMFMPKWLMRGVEENVPTFYLPYKIIFASRHMDEEVAFITAKSLDEHADYFLESYYPSSYNPFIACRQDTEVPFHPGAERYYRSRGYIK